MSVDASTGWNTSTAFQTPQYDPTALANGLQSAANYDPTQQSTTTPTSAARFLSGGLQSVNATATDAPGAANTASNATTPTTQVQTAATTGLTDASNNSSYSSYSAALPNAVSKLTGTSTSTAVPTSTSTSTTAANATTATNPALGVNANQAAAQAARNNLTTYSGPTTVSVRTKDGNLAYYTFDTSTGQYVYKALYDKKGNALWGGAMTAVDANGNSVAVAPAVSDADRASAQLQTIAGSQLSDSTAGTGAALLNQSNGTAISAWQKANTDAYNAQQTAAATAAGTAAQQQALDYMTTHNGALPPDLQTIANNTYSGAAGVPIAQQQGIAAAQAAYAAQMTHSATLSGLNVNPVDTSASDATDQSALNSLVSQYASQGNGAGGTSRMAAYSAAALGGQHSLNHDTAAATSYNNNLSNFANALTTQNNADVSATGNQLYSDIQGVQQIAASLSQEMGQLGTKAQTAAQSQLDNLNNSITNYQQAVKEYGQGSANAIAIAKGILTAAATVAAAV